MSLKEALQQANNEYSESDGQQDQSTEDTTQDQPASSSEQDAQEPDQEEVSTESQDESFESEVPKEFHNNERWQKIYNERKQYKSEVEELRQKSIEQVTDDILQREAMLRGFKLVKPDDKHTSEPNQDKSTEKDEIEDINFQYESEEQRKTVETIRKLAQIEAQKLLKPYKEKISKYEEAFANQSKDKRLQAINSNLEQAKKISKEQYGVELTPEVEQDIARMVIERKQVNPDFGTGLMPTDLLPIYYATRGKNSPLVQRKIEEKVKKENQDKIRKQVEVGNKSNQKANQFSYDGLNLKKTLSQALKEFELENPDR